MVIESIPPPGQDTLPAGQDALMEHLGSVVCQHIALATRLERLEQESTSLVEQIETLSHFVSLAYRDPLTELRNRRYFDARLMEELSRARRSRRNALSLLLVDVDGFKAINDAAGHEVGDDVLRAVSAALQEGVRTHDVCCRVGGDEFAVLLPDTSAATCRRVHHRLRAHMERCEKRMPRPVRVSIGHASLREGDESDDLLRRADRAMYREKRHRRHAAD